MKVSRARKDTTTTLWNLMKKFYSDLSYERSTQMKQF